MQQLPPYESVADPEKLCLPARRKTRHTGNQLSLVLDLDEAPPPHPSCAPFH